MHIYRFNVKAPKDSHGIYVAIYEDHTVVETVWSASKLGSDFADKHKDAEFVSYFHFGATLVHTSAGWQVEKTDNGHFQSCFNCTHMGGETHKWIGDHTCDATPDGKCSGPAHCGCWNEKS